MKRPVLLGLVFVCAAAVTSASLPAQQLQSRTIYLNIVDESGIAIGNVRPSELTVAEDGNARHVIRVERASTPPTIALVVHDRAGLPEMQDGLARFINAMPPQANIGIFATSFFEWTVVDYTTDRRALAEGVRRLVPAIAKQSALDLTGLTRHLATEFRRKSIERPIIVMLAFSADCRNCRAGGSEIGSQNWDFAVQELQRTHTRLYSLGSPGGPTRMIEGGTRLSGGWIDFSASRGRIAGSMQRIADDVLNQYVVAYAAPPAPETGYKLSVGVSQPGAKVRAPQMVY